MTIIFNYCRSYFLNSFRTGYFIIIVLLLSGFIYLNYYQPETFSLFFSGSSWFQKFIGSYLLYLIPFSIAFLLQLFFYKTPYFKDPWLWIVVLLGPAFFALRVQFDLQVTLIRKWVPGIHLSLLQCINWIVRAFLLLFLIYIAWYIREKGKESFYGSKALNNTKPYLILLICLVPLVLLAGRQVDFLNVYPRVNALTTIQSPLKYLWIFLFELCYGFDFISIEFFFRGFLIVGLTRVCGMQCIIPAACFYCCIHFGKPMTEAISSFFGGIILGILSYHTKSIWGGLIVHVGVAWLMEVAGFIGHYFY